MSKAAILVDGGYFLKRLPATRPDVDQTSATLSPTPWVSSFRVTFDS